MTDNQTVIHSDLQTTYHLDGHALQIHIFREQDSDWMLEIVDEFSNSRKWEELFATDEAALAEALEEIKSGGVQSLIGNEIR